MTSTRLSKLAREIQKQTGLNYTVALREANKLVGLSASSTAVVPPKARPSASYAVPFDYEAYPAGFIGEVYFGVRTGTRFTAGLNFEEEGNLLIVGSPVSGKTTLMKNLAFSVLSLESAFDASIIAIEDSREYLFANGTAKAVAHNLREALALLRAVRHEVVDRIESKEMYTAYAPEVPPASVLTQTYTNRHVLFISHLLDLLTPVPVPRETDLPEFKKRRDQIIKENAWRVEMNELLEYIVVHGEQAEVSVVCESHNFNLNSPHSAIPALLNKSARILLGDVVHLLGKHLLRDPQSASRLGYPVPIGVGIVSSVSWGDREFLGWVDDAPDADLTRAEILTQDLERWEFRSRYDLTEFMD